MPDDLPPVEPWGDTWTDDPVTNPVCEWCGRLEIECVCHDSWAPWPEDEWEDCGCRYCHCFNRTEHGEVCRDCRNGAHQG